MNKQTNPHDYFPKRLFLLLTASVFLPVVAQSADETSPAPESAASLSIHDRAYVNVGWFAPSISTTLRLDNDTVGDGTDINLEDDLGMDETLSQVSVQVGFYATKRFRISGEYFSLNRSNSKSITREINWGDEVFEAGATVSSFFDLELYRIAFGYDIVQNDHTVFGFAIGAHMLDTAVGIEAALDVSEQSRSVESDASTGGIFPIPNIGLYYNHNFSSRWRLETRADWFGISVGEWDGTLISVAATIRYFFTPNISLGVGLEYFKLDVNYDQESWQGSADLEFYGPVVQLGWRY